MNLLTLSWAYLRLNPLSTLLNLLLLALGMGTIVVLLLFSQQIEDKLTRDARGIDLVVGAKGSPLQLILSSIYHIDVPTGNIPVKEANAITQHKLVKSAIPLALGDSYHSYRIVGTTTAYPNHYSANLSQGRWWEKPLEVAIGAEVAQQTHLELGANFVGSHGLTAGGDMHNEAKYVIVGILAPTGTVLDRLILTSVESVWAVHEHHDEHLATEQAHEADDTEDKELTTLLIQYASPMAAVTLPRLINSKSALQAASPAFETARLLKLVGFGVDTLRIFGGVLILTATLGMFIALYHALQERRYDLAIMRTLGASKQRLLWQLLFEGILLAILGTLLGLFTGHSIVHLLGNWLNQAQQLHLTGWTWHKQELGLFGLAIVIGGIAALLPAIQAYRTDIAKTLSNR